jgi:II/X family phage/plasmid replication protein
MIRWESTLKKRWFERRDIPTKLIDLVKVFDAQAYWVESTKDIFDALAGEQMKILKDDEVLKALMAHFPTVNANTGKTSYGKANAAYRTYRAIKADGYCQVKETMERTSFWRHIEMLTSCGLSKALLQNMQGEGLKAEVIPMVRYAVVEFRNQFPDWLYKVA